MSVISSQGTGLYKYFVPVVWIGGVMVMLAFVIADGIRHDPRFSPVPVIGLLGMLAFAVYVMRKTLWDLMDRVEDHGEFLLVRRGHIEDRIPISDIMNVSMSHNQSPARLALRLRKPCRLGDEVAFVPAGSWGATRTFARNPVAEDLLARVDRMREVAR
ncbi:MAG: hypothetical protein JSR34_02480 [Proteobacteria bacterium]|nr:hypothetical protein [Pseudomonadota bacterium]